MDRDDATGQVAPSHPTPPSRGNSSRELRLCWPGPDRLRQVDVRVRVGADLLHDCRHDPEVAVIEPAKRRPDWRTELADDEAAAGLGHPEQVAQRSADIV